MDVTTRLRDAINKGELKADELTARKVAAYLGRSTSLVYHHYGSLDGLHFAVAQEGYGLLGERLLGALDGGLPALARTYVRFGLDYPELYGLMFERRYDWAALRERGACSDSPGMGLWHQAVATLAEAGSSSPEADARVLLASLHGTVSLALSGRANVGDLDRTDREVALLSATRIAALITGDR